GQETSTQQGETRAQQGGGRRVLVVDDDADHRRHLRGLLEGGGWEVDEAADGREALDRVADRPPGLILLDLGMPGVDGVEFLAALRRREEGRSVPVVVLSATDVTAADHWQLADRAIEKIFPKGSLSREQLLAELGSVLAEHGPRA